MIPFIKVLVQGALYKNRFSTKKIHRLHNIAENEAEGFKSSARGNHL